MLKIILHALIWSILIPASFSQTALKADFSFQIKNGDTIFRRIIVQSLDSLLPNYMDLQFHSNGQDIRQINTKSITKDGTVVTDKKITIQGTDTLTTKQVSIFDNNRMINRQLYDAFGEIVKEDTLSYSKDGNLTGKCSYDYRNNTSLYCDKYKYTNGRLKKWTTFYHWHTISLSGKVVEKREKTTIQLPILWG